MNNPILEKVKLKVIEMLQQECGCCGVAESPDKVMINSGSGDDDFKIVIEDRSDRED